MRSGEPGDVEAMRVVEVDAGRRFAGIGLHSIASDTPPPAAALAWHISEGTAWSAVGPDGALFGYAVASVVDGEGHLDQVSVAQAAAGHGIGRALIDRVVEWAAARGYPALTLTTFRDVAWNGPYYQRLGFVALDPADVGPELAAIQAEHRAAGIEVVPRIAMRLKL